MTLTTDAIRAAITSPKRQAVVEAIAAAEAQAPQLRGYDPAQFMRLPMRSACKAVKADAA